MVFWRVTFGNVYVEHVIFLDTVLFFFHLPVVLHKMKPLNQSLLHEDYVVSLMTETIQADHK